jgi:lipid II:glycine glycyltransferase (peptidoglycan interpeptide bridge formation enzyme)
MFTSKIISDKNLWEKFLLNSSQCTFLQSWNWGVFHLSLGRQIFRLGLFSSGRLQGLVLLIKVRAKRATYLECPGGPVIPWENQKAVKFIFQEIKNLAKQESAVFVRIRPNILRTSAPLQLIKELGLIKAPMHLHAETTWELNLEQSEETIQKNMRKTTRWEINKARRLGVEVVSSTELEDVRLLYGLQLEAARRHRFVPFSQEYLSKQFLAFKKDNQIRLFKAVYQGKVLAVSFIIFYGQEAVYHYSGSADEMGQVPASAALQWQAILTAKNLGLKRYNFWGVAEGNNPRHRFFGVTLFKKGFGGEAVAYLPAQDLVIRSSYWLNWLVETLRRRVRRL